MDKNVSTREDARQQIDVGNGPQQQHPHRRQTLGVTLDGPAVRAIADDQQPVIPSCSLALARQTLQAFRVRTSKPVFFSGETRPTYSNNTLSIDPPARIR